MAALCFVPVASAIAPNLHGGVLAAGNGAPDEQQVALGVDLEHVRPALGDPAGAPLPGNPPPLEDAGGTRAGAARAGRADVVRAVGLGATAEVVALDRALKALADGHRGDLHALTGLEARHRDVVADLHLCAVRLLGLLDVLGLAVTLGGLAAAGGAADLHAAELDQRAH